MPYILKQDKKKCVLYKRSGGGRGERERVYISINCKIVHSCVCCYIYCRTLTIQSIGICQRDDGALSDLTIFLWVIR